MGINQVNFESIVILIHSHHSIKPTKFILAHRKHPSIFTPATT